MTRKSRAKNALMPCEPKNQDMQITVIRGAEFP